MSMNTGEKSKSSSAPGSVPHSANDCCAGIAISRLRNRYLPEAYLLLALLMRIPGLFARSLNVDEGVSWLIASQPLREIVPFMLGCREVHPPLYFFLLHFWMRLGESEGVMRLLSFSFSLLDILFIYLLTKLLLGKGEASLAALFLILSSFHIFYSVELRMYSLLLFLFLFSFYFFLRWLKDCRVPYLFLSLLSTFAALLTHYLSFFIPLIECLYLLTLAEKRGRRVIQWLIGQAIILVTFFSTFRFFFSQVNSQDFSLRETPGLKDLFSHLFSMLFGITIHLPHFLAAGREINLSALCGFAAAVILLTGIVRMRNRENIIFILFYLTAPILILYLISRYTAFKIGELKYFLIVAPALFMLIAAVIWRVKSTLLKCSLIVLFVSVNLYSWSNFLWNKSCEPQNWKLVGGVMSQYTQDGDLVMAHPSMMAAPLYYYYRGRGVMFPVNELPVREFEDALNAHDRVWFCTVPYHPYVKRLSLESLLDARFKSVLSFETENELPSNVIRLKIYEKRGAGR